MNVFLQTEIAAQNHELPVHTMVKNLEELVLETDKQFSQDSAQ